MESNKKISNSLMVEVQPSHVYTSDLKLSEIIKRLIDYKDKHGELAIISLKMDLNMVDVNGKKHRITSKTTKVKKSFALDE